MSHPINVIVNALPKSGNDRVYLAFHIYDVIIQRQDAGSRITLRPFQEAVGSLLIIEARTNQIIQQEVPPVQGTFSTILLGMVRQDGSSPKQVQSLKMLVIATVSRISLGLRHNLSWQRIGSTKVTKGLEPKCLPRPQWTHIHPPTRTLDLVNLVEL